MANGWGSSDVSFFMPPYTQITGAYCVDKAHVFAAGESSGEDFVSILGCEHADVLRAVAPCDQVGAVVRSGPAARRGAARMW